MRLRDRNGDVGTFVVLNGEATKIAGKNARDVLNECIEVYFSLLLFFLLKTHTYNFNYIHSLSGCG